MFFDNKKQSQNGIEKRMFILKHNFFECNNLDIIQKFAWSSLQNLSYTQNDNIITVSSEQSQKNKAADMVQFIAKMGAALNFEKIIYFVKNKKDDFVLTLWEDYKCINETIKDKNGNVIPFTEDAEFVLRSMGSQAAVSVSNMKYIEEIKTQLRSFVSAFATAVDERTPYNGSHTRKVAVYAVILADYINKMYEQGVCGEYFDDNRKDQLHLSAALHDIGKMVVPLSVMNKATRLDGGLVKIEERFKLLKAYYEIDFLKGKITPNLFEEKVQYLNDSLAFVTEIDHAGFMPDEKIAKVEEIAANVYECEDGTILPYLTETEKECLSIRKGTLTKAEREIMESHVIMTHKILNKVHFSKNYSKVNLFASTHHECLDGTGYPSHLMAEDLELESRILAVVDVFDALTSADRPYKKPMSKEKAFAILHDMANKEGKLEDRLVTWLEEAMEEVDMDTIDDMNIFTVE